MVLLKAPDSFDLTPVFLLREFWIFQWRSGPKKVSLRGRLLALVALRTPRLVKKPAPFCWLQMNPQPKLISNVPQLSERPGTLTSGSYAPLLHFATYGEEIFFSF